MNMHMRIYMHIYIRWFPSKCINFLLWQVGPVIGGVSYDAFPDDPKSAFRMPFFVCASAPLMLLPLVPQFMPTSSISVNEVSWCPTSHRMIRATSSFAVVSALVPPLRLDRH